MSVCKTLLWATTNVCSAVALIFTNKILMDPPHHFVFVFTLTSFHFLFTALVMELLSICQVFVRHSLPLRCSLLMSLIGTLSIALTNFSLQFNHLHFYQLSKIFAIPYLVFIERLIYKKSSSSPIKLSLLIILLGMSFVTVQSMQVNLAGLCIAFFSIVITTQYQIWQGDKQHEYQLTPLQINHCQSFPTLIFAMFFALLFECNSFTRTNTLFSHSWTHEQILLILLSSSLALLVNLCSYGLIGTTSTITFQVVGHLKTLAVLFCTSLFRPRSIHVSAHEITGIAIALLGTFLYVFYRHRQASANIPKDNTPSPDQHI